MLLLTIAHKGEAQEFIKRSFTQPADFHFPGIFRSGDDILLLTGEGIEQSILRVSSVLTYFGTKIDRVINMGIAGALDNSLQLNQIYGIRRVFYELHSQLDFPTYLCKETHSRTDCVTAQKPVLDTEYKQSLRQVALIVDRELWGIGFTCTTYGVSFKSYKLISDNAEENTKSDEIKSNASYYSKHLFDFYKKLSLTKESW
jgi:nucleoside phosphorylase